MADETELMQDPAERIDDRRMPPIADDRGPRRRRLFRRGAIYAFVAVAVLAGSGAVWFFAKQSGLLGGGKTPLVRASSGPIKERPAEPGGMTVPNRDKEVYSTLRDEPKEPESGDTLMPPPEEPVAPPEPPIGAPEQAEAPAQAPADTTPPAPESIAALPKPEKPAMTPSEPDTAKMSEPIPQQAAPAHPEPDAASAPPQAEPAPSATPAQVTTAVPGPSTLPPVTYRIQLGALRSATIARKRWGTLRTAHPDLLGDLVPRLQRADLGDRGVFYRLQVGPFRAKSLAEQRCEELKKRNLGCFIVRER